MIEIRLIRPLAMVIPVLLLGCAEPAPGAGANAGMPSRCAAGAAASLVGRAHDEALKAEALRLTGARSARVIRPGQAVTMDFNPDRLNIELDAAGRVQRLHCG